MTDTLTILAAIATWTVAIGTLVILWWQTRVTQRLNSANSVMLLRERFDLPRMRRARRLLSQRLLNGRHEDITNLEVAAFFELIASLTHRYVLDRNLVWEAFGTWVTGYYYALRNPVDVIGRARQELSDPLIMHEFEWLYGKILEIDRHGLGPTAANSNPQRDSKVLLEREGSLDLDEGTE